MTSLKRRPGPSFYRRRGACNALFLPSGGRRSRLADSKYRYLRLRLLIIYRPHTLARGQPSTQSIGRDSRTASCVCPVGATHCACRAAAGERGLQLSRTAVSPPGYRPYSPTSGHPSTLRVAITAKAGSCGSLTRQPGRDSGTEARALHCTKPSTGMYTRERKETTPTALARSAICLRPQERECPPGRFSTALLSTTRCSPSPGSRAAPSWSRSCSLGLGTSCALELLCRGRARRGRRARGWPKPSAPLH